MDKDRIFWEAIYRALMTLAAAIKVRYLGGKVETTQRSTDVIHSQT